MSGPEPIWDREAAERRFVESDLTLAQVAAEFKVSHSQLSKWAAKNTWTAKRKAFRRRPAMAPQGDGPVVVLEPGGEEETATLACPHCGGALSLAHLLGMAYDAQDQSILIASQQMFDAVQKEMEKIAEDKNPVPAIEFDMMSRALERIMKMQRVTYGKDKRVPATRGAQAASTNVGGDLTVGDQADSALTEIERIQALLDKAKVWVMPPELSPGDPVVENVH